MLTIRAFCLVAIPLHLSCASYLSWQICCKIKRQLRDGRSAATQLRFQRFCPVRDLQSYRKGRKEAQHVLGTTLNARMSHE